MLIKIKIILHFLSYYQQLQFEFTKKAYQVHFGLDYSNIVYAFVGRCEEFLLQLQHFILEGDSLDYHGCV